MHSLKDLPTASPPDLEIVAVPAREDTRDVLVGRRLAELTDTAVGQFLRGAAGEARHQATGH